MLWQLHKTTPEGRVDKSASLSTLREPIPATATLPVGSLARDTLPIAALPSADLVAHSGPVARGSFVQTLVLTDIATGWTEDAPLLVREQRLLTEVLGEMFCESD